MICRTTHVFCNQLIDIYITIPPLPGNPVVNLQNWANPGHLPNFLLMPSPQTSMGGFILINFTLFHHFEDLKSLEYLQIHMENINLLIENMWESYGGMIEALGIDC